MAVEMMPVHYDPATVREVLLDGPGSRVIGTMGRAKDAWARSFPWIGVALNGKTVSAETEGGCESRLLDTWLKDRVSAIRSR